MSTSRSPFIRFNGTDLTQLLPFEDPKFGRNEWGSDTARLKYVCWADLAPQLAPPLYSNMQGYPNMFLQPYTWDCQGSHAIFDLTFKGNLSGSASALPVPPPPSIATPTETIQATRFDGIVPFSGISSDSQVAVEYTCTEYTYRYLALAPILGGAAGKMPAFTFAGDPISNRLSELVTREEHIKIHSPRDTGNLYFLAVVAKKAGGSADPIKQADGGVFRYEITETIRFGLINTLQPSS